MYLLLVETSIILVFLMIILSQELFVNNNARKESMVALREAADTEPPSPSKPLVSLEFIIELELISIPGQSTTNNDTSSENPLAVAKSFPSGENDTEVGPSPPAGNV